jgi:hypothetical protein
MEKKCPKWADMFGFTGGDVAVGDELRKRIPPSCTYEKYTSGEGCGMKLPIPELKVDLQVATSIRFRGFV